MTKRVLEAVARNSLLEAARQRQQLGALFCENQFRYIVMSRLSNDGTFGKVGYSSDGQVTKALILELNYRTFLTSFSFQLENFLSLMKYKIPHVFYTLPRHY